MLTGGDGAISRKRAPRLSFSGWRSVHVAFRIQRRHERGLAPLSIGIACRVESNLTRLVCGRCGWRGDGRFASRLGLTVLHQNPRLAGRFQLGEPAFPLCRFRLLQLLVIRIDRRRELLLPLEDGLAKVTRKRRTKTRHVTICDRRSAQAVARRSHIGLRQFLL